MRNNNKTKYTEDLLYKYINSLDKIPLLTVDEEKELFIKYKNGDETVKNKLIESNLRLVVNIARSYVGKSNLKLMDIIQEGNWGLIKAVENYDVSKGYKFSTYATITIVRKIDVAISKFDKSVSIPSSFFKRLKKYLGDRDKIQQKFGIDLSLEEISELLDISLDDIGLFDSLLKDSVGLKEIITKKGVKETKTADNVSYENILPDNKPLIEEITIERMMQRDVRRLMNNSNLTYNEFITIMYRYGMDKTLSEVG